MTDDGPPEARATLDAWIDAVIERHASRFDRPALLKAIRALSARYVENRGTLTRGSPADSAGKRAAFAAFYAPLHALTLHAIVEALGRPAPDTLVDLGCGTAAASLAWAVTSGGIREIQAVDINRWSLEEAAWNCRWLNGRCRMRRGSLIEAVDKVARTRGSLAGTALLAAWSINELPPADRDRLLPLLLDLHARGAAVLIVEPLARRAVPWWDGWAEGATAAGGQAAEWKFPLELPATLAALDQAAGFRREELGARTIWLPGSAPLR